SIRSQMEAEVLSLPSGSKECRAVFSGPPFELLEEVFNVLVSGGPLLPAQMADGTTVHFPVVLQCDDIPARVPVASFDRSGYSPFHGLATLRNDPRAGIFLTLVPPGAQASDTHESTRKAFGLASGSSEGGSSITTWWR